MYDGGEIAERKQDDMYSSESTNQEEKKQGYLDPDEHESTTKVDRNVRKVGVIVRTKEERLATLTTIHDPHRIVHILYDRSGYARRGCSLQFAECTRCYVPRESLAGVFGVSIRCLELHPILVSSEGDVLDPDLERGVHGKLPRVGP